LEGLDLELEGMGLSLGLVKSCLLLDLFEFFVGFVMKGSKEEC